MEPGSGPLDSARQTNGADSSATEPSPASGVRVSPDSNLVPLWLKVAFTAFIVVLVPTYAHFYGGLVFLWFCDVALMTMLVGLWARSALLHSMVAVGITMFQTVFAVDFGYGLVRGYHPFGFAEFMFDSARPLWLRGLSLYHFWFPVLALWLVRRHGYRSAAWGAQSVVGCLAILAAFLLVENPEGPAGNVNWVFGVPGETLYALMGQRLWVVFQMVFLVVVVYYPVHAALEALFGSAGGRRASGSSPSSA